MTSSLSEEDFNEIKGKAIVHWNYRGLFQLPEAIRFCAKDIREIYLKDNKLKDLPNWIIELVNVTHLYFHGNNLKRMPPHLASMTHLTLLDLSKNGISELPSCIGDLKLLENLILDDNFLKQLPSELKRLTNLLSLSICNNEFVVLPEWLGSLEKLEQLRADENSLKELPNRLTKASSLRVLSVCSNRLSERCLLNDTSSNRKVDLAKYVSDGQEVEKSINLQIVVSSSEGEKSIIELPRQLFKIHSTDDNEPVSLWELALRRIYDCERDPRNAERENSSIGTSYNLLVNGPIAVCVNENCREPIFTETWLIPAISCPRDSIAKRVMIVALYCSKKYIK